ncbi:MAG: hypothetical protein Q8Q09_09115 [Deltaproteobacteria bacterium]|nr:hypothetical protein [Deltaproteobacteria bacterium]
MSTHPLPPSRIERLGMRFMRSFAHKAQARGERVEQEDALHVLNPRERALLRTIERNAIARAAAAGALSGLVCALPSMLLGHHAVGDMGQQVSYWAAVGLVTVVASIAEILFLYWDGLRAVHDLSRAAGLSILDEGDADDVLGFLRSLTRAALELPDPPEALEGLSPLREAPKLVLVLSSLAYKAKVVLTGFIVKALIRRALGRAATRAVLELVAMPVTALWDAVVCWMIVREARLRVMGPSAAIELTDLLLPSPEGLSDGARDGVLRAVGASVVRSRNLHPNHAALLRTLEGAVDRESASLHIDDSQLFLQHLPTLSHQEQTLCLRVLATASIIDGRLAGAEQLLLAQAFAQCNRAYDGRAIERLRRAFVSGKTIPYATLEAIG